MSATTKVVAFVVVAALLIAGGALFMWFRWNKAHDLLSATAATVEAQSVSMTASLEMDDKTLRELMSDQDVLFTSRDVASIGLRLSRQASDQPSTVPGIPGGTWSYSLTYEGQPAATAGVTEATGTQVLAVLLDPDLIDSALAQLTRSTDLTVDALAAEALDSVGSASPWKPYLEDLLAGRSVGVNLGEGSFVATTLDEALSTTDTDPAVPQSLYEDMWERVSQELPSVVTMTELGTDEYGTEYSVVVDVPRLTAVVSDALRQSCDQVEGLDEPGKESCREAADDLAASASDSGLPAQFEVLIWTKDGKVSRVVIDVAKIVLNAAGPDAISSEAVIRVVMDLAYDQPPFDFADLVVIPDEVLAENLEDPTSDLSGMAAPERSTSNLRAASRR